MAVIGAEILDGLFVFAVNAQVFVGHPFVQFVVSYYALRSRPPFLLRTGLNAEFDILGDLSLEWLFLGSNWVPIQMFAVFIFCVNDRCFFLILGLICKCRAYSILLAVLVNHSESHVSFAVVSFQLFSLDQILRLI